MNKHYQKLTRDQIAYLVANFLPEGAYVNLGFGMPTKVTDYLPADKEIILHSENGILGMGTEAKDEQIDTDLINASKVPITLLPGASITEHTNSFAMMRGGHLDYSILGGFQVAKNGDLANWITDAPNAIAAIGGAMDLAIGAKSVIVMMEHVAKDGSKKILNQCTYPLTGKAVVDFIYTDLGVFSIKDSTLYLEAIVENLTLEELQNYTEATIHNTNHLKRIHINEHNMPEFIS